MRPEGPPRRPVTNSRSSSATPFSASASRSRQQIFEPAAFRAHHPREIEAAGRPARIFAVDAARKFHAHGFEIRDPVERIHQRFPHQELIGDAVIAGDDFARDAVDVVVRGGDDHPGIGERGVTGAAGHPGNRRPRPWCRAGRDAWRSMPRSFRRRRRRRRECRSRSNVPCMRQFLTCAGSPGSRSIFHRRMHVDDLLGTENLAAKASDAVLAKFDHRQELGLHETVDRGLQRHRLHVDHVGRTDVIANAAARALFKCRYFRSSCVFDRLRLAQFGSDAVTRRIATYGPSRSATVVLSDEVS